MYCSECGAAATGKFCTECGTRLSVAGPRQIVPGDDAPHVVEDLTGDWSQIVDCQTLLRYADVRERLAQAASESTAALTGEEFMQWCETALTPLTQVPIPFAAIAKIGQSWNTKLGMKTGKQRCEFFPQPPGQVLVSVLCSLARHGRKLKQVRQIDGGCVVESELGSDMFSLTGNVMVTVRRHGVGTVVEAATHIPGQLFDWGKSSRCLEQIMTEAHSAAA